MKTLHPTLLALQKDPAAAPIARASLADNGRLHLAQQFSGTWAGGYTRTANCGDFLLRARTVPSGTRVDVQKITDPTVESQWAAWTTLSSNNDNVFALGVFWTGTYVVVAYQDAASLDIVFRRSTDGVTWEAEATAYSLADGAYLSAASGGAAQSGLMVSYGAQLYWGGYDPAANTWAALDSAGLTMTSANVEGDCFYDSANSRHVFVYAPNGLVRWSRFGLVVQTRSTAGAWGTPRVYLQSDNLGCRFISVSQSPINGFWWLTFGRMTGWGSGGFWMACSDDGVYWEEPLHTDIGLSGHANVIGEVEGFTGQWLASEEFVYKATAQTFWGGATLPVVRYDFTAGDTTRRVGGGRAPHMRLVVDNRDGQASAPTLNAVLTLERGYHLAGSDYYQSAGTYYVVGFRYLLEDQLLEIHAIDTIGLLTTFVSDAAFNFEGETVQALLTLVCALAGLHAVSFDSSPLWAETVAAFTHPANENGRVSLESLAERIPFDYSVAEDGTVNFYVPEAAPAATYTYGAGEHVHWPGEFGRDNARTYVKVIGAQARTAGGEAGHQASLYEAGRRYTEFILDRRVKTSAAADQLAAARVVFNTEREKGGYLEAPPNFALEVGDVLAFSGSSYAAGAGPWRVEQIQELFNHPGSRKFLQRIWLRGTA